MTTAQAVGAVSREAAEWYAIDCHTINRNVRRLQARIVQARKAGRWEQGESLATSPDPILQRGGACHRLGIESKE
jgi:hypothetical protein